MLMFVGYSLVMGFVASHIDNAAHIGGMVGGFAVATVMAEKFDWDEVHRRAGLIRAVVAVIGASMAMMVIWKLLRHAARAADLYACRHVLGEKQFLKRNFVRLEGLQEPLV